MPRVISLLLFSTALMLSSITYAQDKKDPNPREKRDGLVLGLDLGVGLARSSGYPNDPKAIDAPGYFSRSNTMVGTPFTILLQGAIHDQVDFGFMIHSATFESSRWRANQGGIGFRADVFPFMKLVPQIGGLALFGAAGVGFSKLENKANIYPNADTVQSYLSLGSHYEFTIVKFSGSHFAGGPQLTYDSVFSRDFSTSSVSLGGRLVFYTGK